MYDLFLKQYRADDQSGSNSEMGPFVGGTAYSFPTSPSVLVISIGSSFPVLLPKAFVLLLANCVICGQASRSFPSIFFFVCFPSWLFYVVEIASEFEKERKLCGNQRLLTKNFEHHFSRGQTRNGCNVIWKVTSGQGLQTQRPINQEKWWYCFFAGRNPFCLINVKCSVPIYVMFNIWPVVVAVGDCPLICLNYAIFRVTQWEQHYFAEDVQKKGAQFTDSKKCLTD